MRGLCLPLNAPQYCVIARVESPFLYALLFQLLSSLRIDDRVGLVLINEKLP